MHVGIDLRTWSQNILFCDILVHGEEITLDCIAVLCMPVCDFFVYMIECVCVCV